MRRGPDFGVTGVRVALPVETSTLAMPPPKMSAPYSLPSESAAIP